MSHFDFLMLELKFLFNPMTILRKRKLPGKRKSVNTMYLGLSHAIADHAELTLTLGLLT